MSWDERSAMSLRMEFVLLTTDKGANIRELCRRFKISPNTGYKWIKRYQQEGISGLAEQSRRPDVSPLQTAVECEKLILDMRKKNPAWGARKIKRRYEDLGFAMPAVSTVHVMRF